MLKLKGNAKKPDIMMLRTDVIHLKQLLCNLVHQMQTLDRNTHSLLNQRETDSSVQNGRRKSPVKASDVVRNANHKNDTPNLQTTTPPSRDERICDATSVSAASGRDEAFENWPECPPDISSRAPAISIAMRMASASQA